MMELLYLDCQDDSTIVPVHELSELYTKMLSFTANYILTLKKRKGSLRKEIHYIQNKDKNYLLKIKAK